VAALPVAAGATFMLRAVATDGSGLTALRTWGIEDVDSSRIASPELAVAVDWRRTRLSLDLTSPHLLTRPPDLFLESADGTTQQLRGVRQTGEQQWTWTQPLQALPSQPRRLRIVSRPFGAAPFEQQLLLPAQIVRHGEAQVVDTLLDGWELALESTTFFEDVAVRMQPFDSNELPLGRELNATGAAVAVEAREAAVNRRIRLRYRPSTDSALPSTATDGVSMDTPNVDNFEKSKTGLFYVDRSGNLQFLSAQRDEQGALVGRARYLTVFAVLADTTAPRLRRFKNTTQRGKTPRLRFSVSDAGAGLDSDGLSLTIDGTLAIPEWDPETTRVLVHPTRTLTSGSHSLHVVAVDQLGNRREHTWTFKIP